MTTERQALHTLSCHPATPADAAREVAGTCTWTSAGQLEFHYRVEGDLSRIRVDADGRDGTRRASLWEHTCCEAFVEFDVPRYLELNFAPNGDWAAFAFASYRSAIAPDPLLPTPVVRTANGADWFTLDATVDLSGTIGQGTGAPLRVALTAVIEECDCRRSYWALRHGRARPDFHDRDGFVLRIDRDELQGRLTR